MLGYGDAVGNIFNALGRMGSIIKQMDACQAACLTAYTAPMNGIILQLATQSDIQAKVGSSYQSNLDQLGQIATGLPSLAAQYLCRLVFLDNPLPGMTSTTINTLSCLVELIRQMNVDGATIQSQTVVGTTSPFIGVGNGITTFSSIRPFDGLVLENAFSEAVRMTCTADSYSATATAGNEPFSVSGQGGQPNYFAQSWPLGSGASTSLQAINGNANNSQGNLLTNSGFENFTSNAPNNFTIDTGTPGTDIFEEDTIVFDPQLQGKSLRLQGDGSTILQFRQGFGTSTGTTGQLTQLTAYSFNLWMRRDGGGTISAGSLEVALVDSGGGYIYDQKGIANALTFDLTTLSTSWVAFNGVFRTPYVLPTGTAYIRFRVLTPISTGRSVYMDLGSLGQMTQLGASFPFFAVHSGCIPFQIGDYSLTQVVNSRDANLNSFGPLMLRLFQGVVLSNELLFPSSPVPFISDNLII